VKAKNFSTVITEPAQQVSYQTARQSNQAIADRRRQVKHTYSSDQAQYEGDKLKTKTVKII
jgi:hypothetical protein